MTTTPAMLLLPLGLVIITASAVSSQSAAAPPETRRDTRASDTPAAEGARRVEVTAASASAYSCAATTCRVVTELTKGAVVSVLKTDGDWHQILVRLGNTATTGWVRANQVAATTAGAARTGTAATPGMLRGAASEPAPAAEADPRGCLTCLATREPTPDEWSAALADAATRKVRPEDRPIGPGIADGRTSEERMRDAFEARYGEELGRLARVAADVDRELQVYLAGCVERFASIPVEGAPPRSNAVDDILRAARSAPGAARFQLWTGTAAFQWQDSWGPQADPTSTQPSCGRLWEDARAHADRLKVDVEMLERDAQEQGIYPAIIREGLEARVLAEAQPAPAAPVTSVK